MPDIIQEFIEKSRLLTGKVIQEREPWNTAVTPQAIRHFAYGISDDNPLWLDPDYAAKSHFGQLVAPPTFLTSVAYPALHGAPMKLSMSQLIGELEYQWFHPILAGDTLRPESEQTGVYESQDRQGHRLVCILSETRYWNKNNELVGKAESNLVWIERTPEDLLIERKTYQYSEAEITQIQNALNQEIRTGNQALWGEEIEVGQELPVFVRGPLTVGDLICWQAAIGPSYRPGKLGYFDGLKSPHTLAQNPVTGWSVKNSQQHEDFLMAQQRGMPAPFDNSVMRFAWLSPLLTNWMGDRGELKQLSVQMTAPILYGDTTWYRGIVSKKISREMEILVEVKITGTNQLGEVTTTGKAEVLLPSKEKSEFIFKQVESQYIYPTAPCIHELIEAEVKKTPDAIAVVCQNQRLTYQDLNHQANQLANYLRSQGVKTNDLVGICLDRSIDFVVSILAILKAGGGYLPLDANYPKERLAFMLKDAQISLVLTKPRFWQNIPQQDTPIIDLDNLPEIINQKSSENLVNPVNSNHLAYAVYTSGSTGQPKAVPTPHFSLSSYIRSIQKPLNVRSDDNYLHTGSFSFSAAVRQTLLPLSVGATLIIADTEQRQNPQRLFQLIQQENITIWDTVPTFWRFCIDLFVTLSAEIRINLLKNKLRQIFVTGEPLTWDIPYRWRYELQHQARMINLYSQSETTGTASYYLIPSEFYNPTGIVPLGKTIEDVEILLLDENLQPVIEGEIGELCVTGQRLVQGYLNRPQLTAQKFIQSPFESLSKLYKTGDLARYGADGVLEFVGRADRRVKIRGFRVELEEIEAILTQYPDIQEAVVMAHETPSHEKQLVAYVISSSEQNPTTKELRTFIQEKLPEYMVPAIILHLETLPRTPNGKLDRRSLPEPNFSRLGLETPFVAPQDELELQLTQIWETVLGIQSIGIQDNFFELGGHSLLAVRLFTKVEQKFGKNLPLAVLFQAPTIQKLAHLLHQEGWSASWSSLIAIQANGSKPPLFCVHGIGGNIFSYRNIARYLPSDQPVYGLQAQGLDGQHPYLKSIEEMATHYLQEIQSVQPKGPYFLVAHSFGGKVIFEMAQQLHQQGEKVALLALLDSSSPEQEVVLRSPQEEQQRKEAFLSRLPDWSRDPKISPLVETLYHAKRNYRAQVYPGKVIFFVAHQDTSRNSDQFIADWKKLVLGGLDYYEVNGDHWSMLEDPHVQGLTEKLQNCIEQIRV